MEHEWYDDACTKMLDKAWNWHTSYVFMCETIMIKPNESVVCTRNTEKLDDIAKPIARISSSKKK